MYCSTLVTGKTTNLAKAAGNWNATSCMLPTESEHESITLTDPASSGQRKRLLRGAQRKTTCRCSSSCVNQRHPAPVLPLGYGHADCIKEAALSGQDRQVVPSGDDKTGQPRAASKAQSP